MGRGRAVTVLLATIAAAVCAACGGGGGSSSGGGSGGVVTSSRGHASPGTSRLSIIEDDNHLLVDPTATLDVFRALGANEVRIFMSWHGIAPDADSRTRPAGFDAADPGGYPAAGWAPYDAAVRAAALRGIGVYLLLTGEAPLWATHPPAPGVITGNPRVYEPSGGQFGEFVTAVAKRYDGSYTPPGSSSPLPRVHFWGIWNEPNYGYDLQPQALGGVDVSPRIYRGLLDSAWSALHATGHAGDTILFGETAPRGANKPGVANGMLPLRFLRGLYCVGPSYQELRGAAAADLGCPTTAAASGQFRTEHPALFTATGFADHLYTPGQVAPPNVPTPASEPDYAGLSDVPKLERALDRLSAIYGSSSRFPIYNTEFGFQTDPPRSQCGCVFLSPATAAYYLNWAEYLSWHDPRIRSESQYLLYDSPGPLGQLTESTFSSGLLFPSGVAKPSFDAYRFPIYLPVTSATHGRSLEVWGDLRPAAFAGRDTGAEQQVAIQFRPASGGAFTTLRTVTVTDPGGYFEVPVTFPASGSVRLLWAYPSRYAFLPAGSPRPVTSRTQAVEIS